MSNSNDWAVETAKSAYASILEMVEAYRNDSESDEALDVIMNDPLEIEVGGFWNPGGEPVADSYRILITTGGPAVRIVGDLKQHGEPENAFLEVQDWGRPWTRIYPGDVEEDHEKKLAIADALAVYAGCFYYGS